MSYSEKSAFENRKKDKDFFKNMQTNRVLAIYHIYINQKDVFRSTIFQDEYNKRNPAVKLPNYKN